MCGISDSLMKLVWANRYRTVLSSVDADGGWKAESGAGPILYGDLTAVLLALDATCGMLDSKQTYSTVLKSGVVIGGISLVYDSVHFLGQHQYKRVSLL